MQICCLVPRKLSETHLVSDLCEHMWSKEPEHHQQWGRARKEDAHLSPSSEKAQKKNWMYVDYRINIIIIRWSNIGRQHTRVCESARVEVTDRDGELPPGTKRRSRSFPSGSSCNVAHRYSALSNVTIKIKNHNNTLLSFAPLSGTSLRRVQYCISQLHSNATYTPDTSCDPSRKQRRL